MTLALTTLFLLTSAPVPITPTAPASVQEEATEVSYEDRMAEAGDDLEKLWELHKWCREQHKYSESRKTLKKIIQLDPEHKEARDALGHSFYDGQWFESSYKLSEYKRGEEKRMLDEKGLVRVGEEWVPVADAPYLRMGWVKTDSGEWLSKRRFDEKQLAEKYAAEGWKTQTDGVWVSAEEAANWEKGLWKCGEEWLPQAEADAYHAQIQSPWTYPGQYFEVRSTLDWNGSYAASLQADQTYKNLIRAFGVRPKVKPIVTVLHDVNQYNGLADGTVISGVPPADNNSGSSSLHYAYMGEVLFDMSTGAPSPTNPPEYLGGGICYWDRNDEKLSSFGPFAVRYAAALSYGAHIDPSWNAIGTFMSSGGGNGQIAGFWEEKRLPRWFLYGAASYVERFFKDENPQEGYGEWWARDWALDNIRRLGGPRPFDEIFAFNLDANQAESSGKLIHEAGMLVSFVLDGDCKPVQQAHQALKGAFKAGEDTGPASKALEAAIKEHEEEFHQHVRM